MKIIYLHQYFCTPSMPGGTRSFEMARRLVRSGHEVHMITSDMSPGRNDQRGWRETYEAGIHVHWLPVAYSNEMSHRQRVQAFLRFACSSALRARQVSGDVVFASSTPLTIAIPGLYAARRLNRPFVFEIRDLWPEVPIAMKALRNPLLISAARHLERLAYQRAAHVVALSPWMRAGVLRCGIAASKVSVIPNGCDFELFDVPSERGEAFRRRYDWLGKRPLVVYAGTIGKVNGLQYMVRLAALCRQNAPDVRFLVVGNGREEALVRNLAAELDVLDRNFYMMDRVPKQAMPEIFSAADLTTSFTIPSPSLNGDSANKILDSLAAGRPAAVNHGGYLGGIMEQANCGLQLAPDDPQHGAELLIRAITDPVWLSRARAAARHVGRSMFDRDVLASKLEEVLLRVAGVAQGPKVIAA